MYMCEKDDFFSLPCQSEPVTFNFKYDTEDDKVRVGFQIYFEGNDYFLIDKT